VSRKIHVSRKRTETEIHTLIRIITRLVFDKLNLIDFKLGVGIVEIIKTEINKVQARTLKVRSSVPIVKPNLWLSILSPRGISSR
jgi:hypothetical protein